MAIMEAIINHVLYDLDMRPVVCYDLTVDNKAEVIMTHKVCHDLGSRAFDFGKIIVYMFNIERAIIVKLIILTVKRHVRDKPLIIVSFNATEKIREQRRKLYAAIIRR